MRFIKKLYFRQIAIVVAFTMLIIGSIPAKSMGYMIGAEPVLQEVAGASATRAESMAKLQRVLESKLVSEKLQTVGLTPSEVETRVERLSDSDLHQFAAQLDTLYPGGDGGFSVIIALLVIVILVMIILKINDRKIVIK